MKKNVASQRIYVFAFNYTTGAPVTGDAAQITMEISKDNGAFTAITDTNPTELAHGRYYFDVAQAESNADIIVCDPVSSTSNVVVLVEGGNTIVTVPPYFADLGIASDGDVTKVNALDDKTGFSLAATGADLILKTSTFVQAIVAAINELATYGLTALKNLIDSVDGHVSDTFDDVGDVKAVVDYILADTNELQADWHNGGRLDLLIDSIVASAASSAAWGYINSGIVFRGIASAGTMTTFTIGGLIGQGAGAFVDVNTPWYAYVFRDAGGVAAAPQGETRTISAYNSATGAFEISGAFTEAIASGDDIIIMSGRIAAIPEIKSVVDDILVDTGTTLQGELDGIQADTEDLQTQIGVAGAGLTAVPWNASWDTEVQSECTDALNAYDPPTKAELDTAVADVSVDEIQASALADLFNTDSGTDYASAVAGSPVKEIADNAGGGGGDATEANQDLILTFLTLLGGAGFDTDTDSLEAIRNHGDTDWITGGGLTGSNPCTLTIHDGSGNNIVDAFVEIWDNAGTTFYERKITNASGQTVHNLDNGTYTVKIHKAGYSFDDETLVVDGAEAETYIGTAASTANVKNLRYCQVLHETVYYDVIIAVDTLDQVNDVLQEWALANEDIGVALDLPAALIQNEDIREVLTTKNIDGSVYVKA